ncbi:TIGR03086 family metal-binding protein [Mycobacterium spongiae]|uniref:TIGR03086 family protein n=1 Tax=Mycobacterium spongiae TaxID=886343 RepID=A0A975K1C7_9MYCO|nr:TIGR03086 family metal-binding protein [Mycobacterium spongiae]QUR69571.1 TIGR03086 family protein [Mycobacterium spongiae]
MLEVAAEPTRRRLLQLLALGERTVTQLASQFPVTRSAISQHLAVLAEVGLVAARKQGRERYYRLDERGMLQLRAHFESFWSDELDRLVVDAAHYTPAQGEFVMPFEKTVVLPLDPAETFALITRTDRLRRWMTVAGRVELRNGGAYRWTVTPGHTAAGTVVDIEPGKKVVFSWGWEDDGDPPPGGSTVTITLHPVDGGTEVKLVHDGLTQEQAARHAEGWNHFLDRLVLAGHHGDAGPDDWGAAPDPLDELSCAEATLAALQHVLRGFDAAALSAQTPCAKYDVTQLADHLMGSTTAIGAAAGAQVPPRDKDAPLETQVADAAQVVLEAWRRRGLDGTVELNSNPVPAVVPISILSLEFLVHAWDFAHSAGRQVVVSDPVADFVLGVARQFITPEARSGVGFAEPVAIGDDAGVLDQLIAFTGRQAIVAHVSAK